MSNACAKHVADGCLLCFVADTLCLSLVMVTQCSMDLRIELGRISVVNKIKGINTLNGNRQGNGGYERDGDHPYATLNEKLRKTTHVLYPSLNPKSSWLSP